jgi:GNAT superfamily N-acetyltransferase
MTYVTKELTPATWRDFERLFEPGRGWAFCACMLYHRGCHLPSSRYPRAAARLRNLAEKRSLLDAGQAHGVLVYSSGAPVGWCQYGPVDELPLPGSTTGRDSRVVSPGAGVIWRVTCFVTAVRHRRQGVAGAALRAVVTAIQQRGGGLTEAYPTLTPHDPDWAHTGTVALFEQEGFAIVARPSPRYVVMQRTI